jgi:hypothetical protein
MMNEENAADAEFDSIEETSKFSNIGSGCFFVGIILFLLTWIGFTSYFVDEANQFKEADSWPTASGEVIETKISSHRSSGSSSNRSRKTTYTPKVLYRYQVAGQEFENQLVQHMTSYDFKSQAQKILNQYPVGSTVVVYYQPEDPNSSVLVPGISDESQLVITIFTYAPAIILAIILFFALIKRIRRG